MATALQLRLGSSYQGRLAAATVLRRGPIRFVTTSIRASGRSTKLARSSPVSVDQQVASRREALIATTAATLFVVPSALPAVAADAGALNVSRSGLQWKDVEVGTGPAPAKGSTIRCHYTGRLTNGAVFDSSVERGRPLSFQIGVGQVIKGWDMGILGTEDIPAMKEGGKRLLVIPPELGYGARGAGGVIPPNATLEFDVELLPRK
ncbi:hypothetical protein Agub_g10737 [Astrephomene gubernaculifera]|uniref:peptidylprolyl isomerase n=1 Tax=Astrephomene gubernaculifera TaxID=47775 RepID=A0AAD3DXB0_9CHLO|nr:hypothetical protein Agub_g10737 [Astrephomene gubernaculifera]